MVNGRTVGNLPNFIHKIHVGPILAKKSYNYGGVTFTAAYPQDIRNCDKCHDSAAHRRTAVTPQGYNWKTNANRLACGSCHDGINFDTGCGLRWRTRQRA